MLRRILERAGLQVTEAKDGRGVLRMARSRPFDIILLDLEMPGLDGLSTLKQLREFDPDIPVLMVSGVATVPVSIQATRLGAFDFVEKPVDPGRLVRLVRHAVTQQRLALAVRAASDDGPDGEPVPGVIGTSATIRRLKQQLLRVARYDVPVLVLGESGVGKELISRAVHDHSGRAEAPFVAFNAAAVPDTLFESTLFGHTKGSFTGADRAREGLMRSADGGTLVLDEIGDLSLTNQVKLLRALETTQVLPVGASRPVDVDVRVVACTNADLASRVADGAFRADLYYRLRGVMLQVPPLRDRPDDVSVLAKHFLDEARRRFELELSGFEPAVLEWFSAYSWPGNVRELKHVVMSAALMTTTRWVGLVDLPAEVRAEESPGEVESATPQDMTLDAAEKRHVQRVLALEGDNRSAAARRLGVSRSTMYRLLTKHGLG